MYIRYIFRIYIQQWLLCLIVEHKIHSHFMRSHLFHFQFNLSASIGQRIVNEDIVECMLNNCKKAKIFLDKYAIYDRKLRISSFGLTCFVNSRLTGTWVCSFCSHFSQVGSTFHTSRNFQVSEEEKKEGLENEVFKASLIGTFIRRSNSDVFPRFQIVPSMKVLL